MLYQYEAEVLKFVNRIIPEIVESTYTKQEDAFTGMAPVMKYPAFMYSRVPTEYNWSKSIDIRDGDTLVKVFPYQQVYVARIFAENSGYVFDIATRLRFGWNEGCKVKVKVLGEDIDVSLWLLYIKIDEERASLDKKGAKRFVEFSWKSNLVMLKDYSEKYRLVETITYKLVASGVQLSDQNGNILEVL